jgi:hypothetical protein
MTSPTLDAAERAEFEKWYLRDHFDATTSAASLAWKAWQARAALSAPQLAGDAVDARRLQALQIAAKRYWWLRTSDWYVGPSPEGDLYGVSWTDRNDGELDAAIDSAIQQQEGK